jgi:cysteine desulfurase
VSEAGRIEVDALEELLGGQSRPALVHCQWANHEVGTVQPVAEVVAACRRAGVPVHVDAAAACGHLDLDLTGLDADLVTVSGHKFGAPPGVGALVVRRGLRLEPLLVGGQQERRRRAGMEPVPAIVGMGAAAAVLEEGGRRLLAEEATRARLQVERILAAALAQEGVALVGDPEPTGRLPHLACLGVDGVEAEPVLMGLDRAGVAAHSGSSCASESLEPSPVLEAMGVDASRSLRLSVGWSTTDDDVDAFTSAFGPVVRELRALQT